MARVAITGASGLVGGNLAVALLAAGHAVRATRRGTSKVEHLSKYAIEWVTADLDDTAALAKAFDGVDWVFHCAAQVSVLPKPTPALVRANVEGTVHVIDAVRQAKAKRLIHCSSVAAVGLSENGKPCDESTPWNFDRFDMVDGYCTTKHWAEEKAVEAAKGGLDVVIVNPTYMFGPFDAKPSSGKMIINVAKRKVPGFTPGFNNYVDVRDVVKGMIAAAERGERGERYILGSENLSYTEVFTRIAGLAGVQPPKRLLPRAVAAPFGWWGDLVGAVFGTEPLINSVTIGYGYCPNFIFTSDKAKAKLGYAPTPIDAGIRDALAWFREQKMLA